MAKRKLGQFKSFLGLALLILIVFLLNPRFIAPLNLLNVLRQTSINAIIAAGMTFVILTGGIDLSVGSVLAFCGAISAALVASGLPIPWVIFFTLLVGLTLGLITGGIVSYGGVQPFIATLVSMTILRGGTLIFTQGKPLSVRGDNLFFARIGEGYLLGIPFPVYLMIFVYLFSWYVLTQTRFGRHIYALGGNEEASRLSGLDTKRIKLGVYGISSVLASLSGLIITARLGSAQPTAGTGYELDAIAAVVLGGTRLTGGSGRIGGTIIGALTMGVLNNALNLMNVSSYYQMVAKGLVILMAVLFDRK